MHAIERPLAGLAHDETKVGAAQATLNHDLEVVLKPLSPPDLAEIRISDGVFAVGRNEQPFASYAPDVQVMLSRRHARLFIEGGAVYLADLESRNGTTVNRTNVQHTPARLADGDEICFGGVLTYRVRITSRAAAARPQGFTLTLTPATEGSGLEPLVIARFPFLVSKTDAAFARYRAVHPKQLDFLSRRQAHIFLKDGTAHIEDLASANGTFLDGERLQEHAVPLQDGMLLAFAGDHFVYRVGIDKGAAAFESTEVRTGTPAAAPAAVPTANPGKTTFVAAPDSFLEIFCADAETPEKAEAESAATGAAAAAAPQPAPKTRSRGRVAALVAELLEVAAGGERGRMRRTVWMVAALIAGLSAMAFALSWWVRSERELKDLIERGEYAQAALKADQALQRNPDDVELKALATDAALKANVPVWLAKVAARDFAGARAVLAELGGLAKRNPELVPLVGELEWLGQLEQLVRSRGPDAPIRIYADEDRIAAVIERWNRETREHQRSLGRIASFVPEFNAPYAEALTHLRKLQSDATVYLAAIDRLKASLTTEVARDRAEDLMPMLKETAEKYPGLGGLDGVRQDLARYIELKREARSRKPGRLLALTMKAQVQTPPLRDSIQAMTANGQLPPADVMRSYGASVKAWKEGQTAQALSGLQAMVTGPWADAAAAELQRKQAVLAQHATLQQARTGNTYADMLIGFRESLDADEDTFFLRATQAELEQNRDKVAARADSLMSRARALWQDYRRNGAISAAQRIETTVSNGFRTQARMLAEARQNAQRAAQIQALLGAPAADPSAAVRDEIQAEAQAQRTALQDLRNVLDPQLVKDKLALLGEPSP
jgi:pSer/pThr/pTyr-binding forkhead associated (FHA) protein